jgi:hypothetical protein
VPSISANSAQTLLSYSIAIRITHLWAEIRHIERRINFVAGSPMTA